MTTIQPFHPSAHTPSERHTDIYLAGAESGRARKCAPIGNETSRNLIGVTCACVDSDTVVYKRNGCRMVCQFSLETPMIRKGMQLRLWTFGGVLWGFWVSVQDCNLREDQYTTVVCRSW